MAIAEGLDCDARPHPPSKGMNRRGGVQGYAAARTNARRGPASARVTVAASEPARTIEFVLATAAAAAAVAAAAAAAFLRGRPGRRLIGEEAAAAAAAARAAMSLCQ